MVHIKIKGLDLRLDFTFFAVIALFICFDLTGFGILSVLVCVIHEAGHLTAMLIRGEKPDEIIFRGGGIKIIPCKSSADSIAVIAAGSAVNIALFFLLYFTLPKTDIYPVMFAVLNLVIGVFNLLPIGCLDGRKLLGMFLSEKPLKIIEVITLSAVAAGIIIAILSGNVNFTLIIVLIYIMAVDIFVKI